MGQKTEAQPNNYLDRLILVATITVGALGLALLIYGLWPQPAREIPELHNFEGPTAAIVDQLGTSNPNPDFVENATTLLENAGYNVVYVPAEQVTVDFYRYLPAQKLDVILLRNHASASAVDDNGETVVEDSVSLSTSEPISDNYPTERNARRLGAFAPIGEDALYFSIRWDFFKYDAVGEFDDSVIVMMGCEGLRANKTAHTFLEKGASSVVGWSNLVSAPHMDQATLYLLEQWLAREKSLVEAVTSTRLDIGPDPAFAETELQILQ
jgi:hypothetical protein